jgi:predicted DNA-binding transcriptional regulator YafY
VEHVAIRFSPLVADEIRERRWHATEHLSETADGSLVLEMTVAAPEELERWLLGYGPDAEVLAPAALADRIWQRHVEAAAVRKGTLRAAHAGVSRAAGAKPARRTGG